jgi:hypothetical protein
MNTPDAFDSLMSIYDSPPTERETLSKLYLDLMLLENQLNAFIHTHDIGDAEEDLSRLLRSLISSRSITQKYMETLTCRPGVVS